MRTQVALLPHAGEHKATAPHDNRQLPMCLMGKEEQMQDVVHTLASMKQQAQCDKRRLPSAELAKRIELDDTHTLSNSAPT